MSSKAIFTPSPSFVLSYLPPDYTVEKVNAFFDEYHPKSVKFLYLTPDIFLQKAVVTFETQQEEQDVASEFLGKHQGIDDLSFFYSIQPFNGCDDHEKGEIPTRTQIDDDGANQSPYLPGNFIKDWSKFTEMPNAPKIARLYWVRYNEMTILNKGFERVTNLNLKGNDISSIDSSVSFPNVTICNLSFNRLEHFANFSTFCPKVIVLSLQYNLLVDIDESFSDAPELETLDISHNKIRKLHKLPKSLRTLLAHFNEIEEFDESSCPPLQKLTLWNNRFTKAPAFAKGLIDNPTIARNCLTTVPVEYLCKSLQVLDLSQNNLEELPPQVFKLPSMVQLILYKNKLTTLPEQLTMSGIKYLDISQNPIEELPQIPFCLETLRCNFCGIEDLGDAIPTVNSLQCLHAIGNELTYLPNMSEIVTLMVSHNNLMILPFINANIYVPVLIDASHNQIKTIPPLSSPFTLLDLSYNQLTSIPPSIFKYKSSIKLAGNDIDQEINISETTNLKALDVNRTKIKIKGEMPNDMEELVTAYNGETCKSTRHLMFSGENIGYAEMIGRRPSMEDAIIVREDFKPGVHMVAVFDGHSGSSVARACAASIPDILIKEEKITQESIKKAIADINEILLAANELAGSTMELCVIDHGHLLISQLGDSRTVLFREDGSVRIYTEEMNPFRRDELARLRNNRIRLSRMRTGGMLAMSSSIGDFQVKGINRVPEFIETEIEDTDRWLVVACDGLWDDINNEECAKTLLRSSNAHEAASLLRDQALQYGSEDNISVIVVDLKTISI